MKVRSLIKDENLLNRLIQEGKMPFVIVNGAKVPTKGKTVKNGLLVDSYEKKEVTQIQPVEPKKEPKKVKNETTKSRK